MRTLVISGGTGSISLKRELSKFIDRKNLKTLINCYDNGLSTGLVRKVFDGKILGPSDARKQQFLDYELYRDKVKTEISEFIFETLKGRVTIHKNPEEFIKNEVSDMPKEIIDATNTYFDMPLAKQIKYIDFSLANIIYGGLAYNLGSLQAAVDCMADLLNLPRSIVINDDKSLFLCALTENDTQIHDESEIVDWANPDNKIVDIFFTDIKGNRTLPVLSERSKEAISDSDLIICSPGTQFSSLIPTYISDGFLDSIENKKVYMVKNSFQDKDMFGYSNEEEVKKVLEYIPLTYIDTIFSHIELECFSDKLQKGDYISDDKHNRNLVKDMLEKYYSYNGETSILFDYDDTIFSRCEEDIDVSLDNMKLINELRLDTYLFTGKRMSEIDESLSMKKYFTCYGSSVYNEDREKEVTYSSLSSEEIKEIMGTLKEVKFNFSKIENRDNCIISLRFLEESYRDVLHKFIELKLPELKVIMAGKQTIDIMKKDNCKLSNFNKAFEKSDNVFYVGDEVDGNDKDMIQELNSLHVKDVLCTNTFLKYLLSKKD